MRILVVEDDRRLAAVVRRGLAEAGHIVDVASDGMDGEASATTIDYDVIILDVNLPRRDGFAVARAIRAYGTPTPILMLTSRDTVADTIAGLDAGADDYLRKPFVFGELHARVRSLARRKAPPASDVLRVGDLSLDRSTREIRRGDTTVPLTARETAFLEYFMQNVGIVLTQTMIEDALWESDRDTVSNLIKVYVRRLRIKLSPNGEPELIHTIRGSGYRIAPRQSMVSRSTLRGRLTLALTSTMTLSLCIFAIASLITIDVVQRRSLDAELQAVASAETSTVDIAADGAIDLPDRYRFNSVAGPHVASAIILPDGRIVIASTSNIPKAIMRAATTAGQALTTTLTERGEDLRATFVPMSNVGRHIATVAVWNDADAIVALDRKLGIAFSIVIPLFVITMALACSSIVRRVLIPLEQIITDASEIEEHDGRARVTLPQTTELFRLATALNRMLARLSKAFEREQRFTGDASHELRAPLAIILAEADLALASQRDASEYRRALETIAIEADGLELLTRNLLSRARAESMCSPVAASVDLAEVASSVVERVRILAAARNIAIHSALASDSTIVGNADEIEQAVLTIIHNAVKYAANDGLIVVTLNVGDVDIALNISDDGPGFSIDALAHAHNRFWSEDDRGATEPGHGLGLAIALTIVERYHGNITLANHSGGGASVTVIFPNGSGVVAEHSEKREQE